MTLAGLSLSARRAWIEILIFARQVCVTWSLSARRAWIEILPRDADGAYFVVALRKESVDRNVTRGQLPAPKPPVALRKESVDRNHAADMSARRGASVALRKESVDRNNYNLRKKKINPAVALRKESVDRNLRSPCAMFRLIRRSPQGERG